MESAETQDTQGTQTLKNVKDAEILICSENKLEPAIDNIVLTDKRGTKVFKIEVSGLIDHEVRRMASKIMGLMTDKGYKPEVEVHLKHSHTLSDSAL